MLVPVCRVFFAAPDTPANRRRRCPRRSFRPTHGPKCSFCPSVAPRPHALSSGNYMAPWPHGSAFLAPRDGVPVLRVPLCHWRDVFVCSCVFLPFPSCDMPVDISTVRMVLLPALGSSSWPTMLAQRSACVWSSVASSAPSGVVQLFLGALPEASSASTGRKARRSWRCKTQRAGIASFEIVLGFGFFQQRGAAVDDVTLPSGCDCTER